MKTKLNALERFHKCESIKMLNQFKNTKKTKTLKEKPKNISEKFILYWLHKYL